MVDAGVIYQSMQPAQLFSSIYRCFPILFLGYIVPYERCSMAQFRRKLLALQLDHIANDDLRSFGDE